MAESAPVRLQCGPLSLYLAPLNGCSDLMSFVQRLPSDSPAVWLDSARPHPVTGRWSLLGFDPWLTFSARGGRLELRTASATRVWRGHPLDGLRDVLGRYRPAPSAAHRLGAAARAVGLLGFASYELNRWIERLPAPKAGGAEIPELLWFGMRVVILVDHLERRGWVVSVADPHAPQPLARREARDLLERTLEQLACPEGLDDVTRSPSHPGPSSTRAGAGQVTKLDATMTQPEFERMVERALGHIRAGDIFQANLSQRFTAPWSGPGLPLYERLRRVNPSPFACWLSADGLSVASCSPERLVRVQGGRIDTRPIAGTRPRGASPAEDAVQSLDLLLSEKERAEHIMLVDLARNDLGRIARAGTVAVNEMMALEEYSHVIHIVSDVSAELRPGCDAADVVRALFPGGTITGCPKVRCMELLHELEPVPRGLYTGSLGYLAFDGTLDLNIAIRTMVVQEGRLSFHAGAGIVADSDPAREYHETLAKAAALMQALGIPDLHAHAA